MGMEHRNAVTKASTRPTATELYQPPAIRKLQNPNETVVSTSPSIVNASNPHQPKNNNFLNALNATVDCNSSAHDRNQSGHSTIGDSVTSSLATKPRERRPDRAVYVPRPRRSQTTPPSSTTTSPSDPDKKPDLSKSTSLEVASTNCGTVISCDQIPNIKSNEQLLTANVVTGDCDSNLRNSTVNEALVVGGKEFSVIANCDNSENRMSALKHKKSVPLRIEDAKSGRDSKDDRDEKELQRASKEINRSNRRIMKQTFVSDVLEIPEPAAKPAVNGSHTSKVTVDPETDDWDCMFDDNGDCLDPKLLDELTASVGKVAIEKPKSDYKLYHSKQALLNAEEFPHVLEISNFPMEFKTQDLMMLFSAYKESGFDIKWVDDTHALAVFSSSKIAAEVLSGNIPFVVMKPLTEATSDSRAKAKKCSSSLQPYRQRPETCAALARRLVTGALGVKLKTSPEELANERRVLREAKERKLLAAKLRDEAWES
ncbi:R3H and coiled-coil domain-containing protein 1 isoform X1 [Bradysia coprophila]|uniref:R3H and coiled-coil domain-containing protein 1 isoform X1 n=1 Tax=Bradysia coprophila TaxID=38358 RepID=UPI00187D78A2|nr:R3H and coiled-coil domain-containing protein 1 isoform X1 [Bradysia coprophila]